MPEASKEVQKVRNLLERLVHVADLTYAEMDKQLGEGRGFTTRVLHGVVGLKLEHIISILKVLDIPPGDFFRVLFPAPNADSGGGSIARLLRLIEPEPAAVTLPTPAAVDVDDLAKRIAQHLQKKDD